MNDNKLVLNSSSVYRIFNVVYNELCKGQYGDKQLEGIEEKCKNLSQASTVRVTLDSYSVLWINDVAFRKRFEQTINQLKTTKYIFIYNILSTLVNVFKTVDNGGLENAYKYIFVSEPL